MAIWSHKLTLATDAVYFNQELWLAFGPDGSFRNIVKSVNIPRINEYGEQNQTVPYDTRVRRAPAASTTIYPEHSAGAVAVEGSRSEEHTSELQSLMRISYAVFCLKKKNQLKLKTASKKICKQILK